jgi:hypothetical protein
MFDILVFTEPELAQFQYFRSHEDSVCLVMRRCSSVDKIGVAWSWSMYKVFPGITYLLACSFVGNPQAERETQFWLDSLQLIHHSDPYRNINNFVKPERDYFLTRLK